MTSTTTQQTVSGEEPADQATATPPPLRRQPWLWVLACAALAAGGVVGLVAWMVTSTSQDVVVAARDLDAYQVLGADDIRVVAVNLDPSVAAIPAQDAATLVGQRVASTIEAGGMISPGQVSQESFPPEGSSVVRVTLTPEQSGELALAPGDAVRVVVSAPTATTDAEPTYSAGQVAAVHTGTTRSVVDVLVSHEEAVDLSDAVVAGRASLVHDSAIPDATGASTGGGE
jgi:Flp pilus assembly protein CpaB